MKVIQIVDSLQIGGAEVAVSILARGLKASSVDSYVIALKPGGALEGQLRAESILLDAPFGFGIRRLSWVLSTLLAEKPDVVHTSLNLADLLGGFLARAARVPYVLSYKSSIDRTRPNRQRLYDLYTWGISILSDRVVVLSRALANRLQERRLVAGQKIRVVHYGVELPVLSAAKENPVSRKSLGIGRLAKIVTIVARLEPRKDHSTFIRAAALVKTRVPGSVFMVVGGGTPDYRSELIVLAKESGLGESVLFMGECRDVIELMRLSDLIVLSSTTEGLGLVLLEAMGLEKPVVATRVGGVPEIVVDDHTGLLVEPGNPAALADAMARVLMSPALAERLGKAGKERLLAEFTSRRMVEKMLAVYREPR